MPSDKALLYYFNAKEFICNKGYYPEVFFQNQVSSMRITETYFYREYAWVVLSSGLSEKVVLSVFEKLSVVFNQWSSPHYINNERDFIQKKALLVFNNVLKINALLDMAGYLVKTTIEWELKNLKNGGVEYLRKFKFLGPATAFHFAKNIGLNLAKPDRHLERIAASFGSEDVNEFCGKIADIIGEKRSVVDIILWRYATLNKNYIKEIDCD